MNRENVDIYGSLALNLDQAKFKNLITDVINKLCKFTKKLSMVRHSGAGYSYEDYVVTIKVSRDKRSCEVYRNRTGSLVFAMEDNKVVAIGYEYIFINTHLENKLKELNG